MKTSFGLNQINSVTPEWANWIFRGYFIISKAVIGYIGALAALKGIAMSITTFTIITLTITLLCDPIMYGFSKLFGVVPEDSDPTKPTIADVQLNDAGEPVKVIPAKVILPEKGIGSIPDGGNVSPY